MNIYNDESKTNQKHYEFIMHKNDEHVNMLSG